MGNHHEEKQPNHLAMSQEDYKHHKSDVWKTTILLSIVTIVEVAFAIYYENSLVPKGAPVWILRLFLIVMSLLKAGYIMAVFMHLKHEKLGFILSILLPFTLLIWMIISFLMEGDSWNNNNVNRFGQPDPNVVNQHKGVDLHHTTTNSPQHH
jgi:cytochrome c oxidase subunit 4